MAATPTHNRTETNFPTGLKFQGQTMYFLPLLYIKILDELKDLVMISGSLLVVFILTNV